MRKLSLLFLTLIISGCGLAVRHLDAIWEDNQTLYPKSVPLPPLEVSQELAGSETSMK